MEEVYAITKHLHQNVPPIIVWEEDLIYFGLTSKLTESQQANLIYKTTMEAVKAIKNGNRRSLEEMVIDISRRVPAAVVNQESFIKLLSLFQVRLVRHKSFSGKDTPTMPRTSLFIKRYETRLEIGEKIDGAEFEISVPKILPITIHVSYPQSQSHTYIIPETGFLNIPFPARQNIILIHTLDGNVYTIDNSDLFKKDQDEVSMTSSLPKYEYKFPRSLRKALIMENVIPIVGAGISLSIKKKSSNDIESTESLFPSWKGFIENLAHVLQAENKSNEANYVLSSIGIPKPRYLDALEFAREELGASLWYEILNRNFDLAQNSADPDSLKLSKLIWELSNNLIITTNFDNVLQWACPKPSEFTLLDVQNVEYARLPPKVPTRPTVWHLHGHIKDKEKIIFTREQFESFYKGQDFEAKLQSMFSLLTNRSFLFIGFSADDAYFRQLLDYIHQIYKGYSRDTCKSSP